MRKRVTTNGTFTLEDRVVFSEKWATPGRRVKVRPGTVAGFGKWPNHPTYNLVKVIFDGTKTKQSYHESFLKKIDPPALQLPVLPKPHITEEAPPPPKPMREIDIMLAAEQEMLERYEKRENTKHPLFGL